MSAAVARQDPRRHIQSWNLSISSVDNWLKRSQPGERLVYAHGDLHDAELAAHMRGLQAQGEVSLHHGRGEDGGKDYLAVRNRVRVELPPRPRRQMGPALDPAMSALFLKLKAVARMGERCPSNQTLADALGLPPETVKWAFRQLRAVELIHSRLIPVPGDPKYRVVTIVSTGLETRLPFGGAK